ncbi:MAG: DUF1311 domain-containing protein [Ignavibacteriae bacterium]|nr:DUF1311 domain-containing protein [Ignavibacteriota bacterium]
MKNYFLVGLLFVLLISAKSFSQENKNPIDIYLDTCMEKNPSTMGILKCTDEAFQMWDNELNKYYKLLLGILNDDGAKALKESELRWIEFRDKEFANLEQIYSNFDGTMYIPIQALSRLEIVRTRANQLKDYYQLLTDKR